MNKMLLPYDIVGGSFWLISVGMIGATLFFFFERSKVSTRFHTPMTMIAVVCLMSSIHYFFVKNLAGWLYILGELYVGGAGRANARCGNENVQMVFFSNRLIITIGWAIYPMGYFIEHLGGGIDPNSVNVIYNLADFLNKIVFGLIIYKAAIQDMRVNGQ